MSFFLSEPIDFAAHNAEAREVWEAYRAGRPTRVPVELAGSITGFFQNPALNTERWTFQQFFEDPAIQIAAEVRWQHWRRFHLLADHEMGLPTDGWRVGINFQNSYDAGWVGCPLRFFSGQLPDTEPLLADHKERLYDLPREIPLFNGILNRALEFYDYMQATCPHMEFEGRPILPPERLPGEGTDGLLELAFKVRGIDNVLIDMLTDENYYHDLMGYLTDNLIRRMKGLRAWRWARHPDAPDVGVPWAPSFYFADDAIALLSPAHYQEFVYPYHRRVLDAFCPDGRIFMHLCGDATRHFPFLAAHGPVRGFDTGFPVNHGRLRKELGPDVELCGGPTVMTVKDGTPEEIDAEVRRICASGVMDGGKFILIAANNLAPCTPVENVRALYAAAKRYGQYHA